MFIEEIIFKELYPGSKLHPINLKNLDFIDFLGYEILEQEDNFEEFWAIVRHNDKYGYVSDSTGSCAQILYIYSHDDVRKYVEELRGNIVWKDNIKELIKHIKTSQTYHSINDYECFKLLCKYCLPGNEYGTPIFIGHPQFPIEFRAGIVLMHKKIETSCCSNKIPDYDRFYLFKYDNGELKKQCLRGEEYETEPIDYIEVVDILDWWHTK